MYNTILTLFRTRLWVLLLPGMLLGMAVQAQAAALLTLKGVTDSVKYADDGQVRLSVLSYSEPESAQQVVQAIKDYQLNDNVEVLAKFLRDQTTRGYVFTKAATGHTVKYAWQESSDAGQKLVLLITPALKTRNPYMWKEANTSPAPFSLLELRGDGEQFTLKTSLDSAVIIYAGDKLQLQDFASAATFATMQDDTPYYLKSGA